MSDAAIKHSSAEMNTDPVQHAHNVLGVSKRSDFLAALPVDDGESLQTQTLHGHFRSQQEAMVELIKELIPTDKQTDDQDNGNEMNVVQRLCSETYDLLMAPDSSFSSSSSSKRR